LLPFKCVVRAGVFGKLTSFAEERKLESYTYLRSSSNLDFNPKASLTKYNSYSASEGATPEQLVKPYSNLCGLFAISPDVGSSTEATLEKYAQAIERATAANSPAYD